MATGEAAWAPSEGVLRNEFTEAGESQEAVPEENKVQLGQETWVQEEQTINTINDGGNNNGACTLW